MVPGHRSGSSGRPGRRPRRPHLEHVAPPASTGGRGYLFAGSIVVVLGLLLAGLSAFPVPLLPAPAAAQAQVSDAVSLLAPELVRSNGAELRWTRYVGPSGAPFARYEVHRAGTAAFTPSASTLLTTIRDRDRTTWQDSTAAPSTATTRTFYYKVVANTSPSNEIAVAMPTAGQARLTLQPDAKAGKATYLVQDRSTPAGCYDWNNYGAATNLRMGTAANGVVHRPLLAFNLNRIPVGATVSSATLTLWYPATTAPTGLAGRDVRVHRVTGAWTEGTGTYPGQCNGSGANWYETQGGARWGTAGGSVDGTADASVPAKARTVAGSDTWTITTLVREWVTGTAPNHGMLLRYGNEAIPTDNPYFDYHPDDAAGATTRPRLIVNFTDGSKSLAPRAAAASPGPGATVSGGAVKLAAAAGDDRRVDRVEFLIDGVVVGSDTSAPYELAWNSASVVNGTHSATVRATDDVGNATTSTAVSFTVDNTAAPTGSLTAPASGAVVSGTAVTLSASAADDVGVKQVEFLVDGVRVGTPDTTAPYSIAWNTLHPLTQLFDGGHQVQALVTDTSGQTLLTPARTVTVNNRGSSQFTAGMRLNVTNTDPTDDDIVPQLMQDDTSSSTQPPGPDPYDPGCGSLSASGAGTDTADTDTADTDAAGTAEAGVAVASCTSIGDAPGSGVAPTIATSLVDPAEPCPEGAYCPTVTITNNSPVAWKGGDLRVWYRWYAPNGIVLFEGPATDVFPQTFQSGAVKDFFLTIQPPVLPPGAELGEYRLRIDLYDTAVGTWFAGKGNPPIDNPILVVKELEDKLGLERFWQYDGDDVGAGMTTLTNVANGNMLLRWTPFFAPGRGLATMVDLTYNSLEDRSESPAGENFSLSMSGLIRFGAPLDIHPNKADEVSGHANKWVELVDGDGTVHRFAGATQTDGSTRWTEPPGVNLYLRSVAANPPERRWALTRPDSVTFYFDTEGFPTAVVDRNGNTLTFTLETTPPGEDPGGPKRRITRVTDAGGRAFTIDYWSKAEARKAHVRGKVQRIADHTGSALDFDYYDDGNLLRLTQRGGTTANGEFLADRTFTFTYTTSSGDGPAIADPAARANPDPKTPNQSTRIFSVRDPRANETTYDYYGPAEGSQLRWKLQQRTDRAGNATGFTYDIVGRVTTVSAPLGRVTRYGYDTAGRVTRITDPVTQPRATTVLWSADNKVIQVTEPSGKFTTYSHNANGYLTSRTNQLGQRAELTYVDQQVDPADTGRHLSLLSTVTSPKGVATSTVGDFQWRFSHDAAGNIDTVTDPSGAVTNYDYNLAGSAAPGTLAAIRDANGNPPTTLPSYDPAGLPTEIVDGLGNRTRMEYDADGLLRSIQDAVHAGETGTDTRAYRSVMDYDAFHRLGRQSAPKSTATDRGRLIWSSVVFDPNDNLVRRVEPHYGAAVDDGEAGPVSTATYDAMDRQLVVASSDTSVDPAGERQSFTWDAAGRMATQTRPKGVLSATVGDFTTTFAYDLLDRMIRQTDTGTSTSTTSDRVTHFCYDVAGDLRSVTSPRANLDTVTCPGTGPLTGEGFTAVYDYDAAHRLVAKRDPLGHEERRTYDANGNLASTERDIATGRVSRTVKDYDARDKLVKLTERFDGAAGRDVVTRAEYDPNGNVSRLISPRGVEAAGGGPTFTNYLTSYSYDAVDRLSRVTLPFDSRDGTERRYLHRAYDPNGRLSWVSLPVTSASAASVGDTARTVLTHFDPGWVRTSDDPTNPKVHFDYAAQGWQTRRTPERKGAPGELDETKQMEWEFFNDARLKSRKDQGGQPSTYTYDANNNLTRALDAAGVTDPGEAAVETESTYTGFDEVAKVRHRKQGAATWKFSDYTYDFNSNVTTRRENGEEDGAGLQTKAPRSHQLTYDGADWLAAQLDLGTDGACKDDQRIVNAFWATGWEKQRDIYRAETGCVADPTTWPKRQTTTWEQFDNGKLRRLVTTNRSGEVTESHDVGYVQAGIYVNGHRTSDRYVLRRAEGRAGVTTCLATSPCDAEFDYDARDKLIRHQKRVGKVTTYALDEPDKLIGDQTIRAGNVTTENADGQVRTRRYTGNQITELTAGGATGKYWYDSLGNVDCVTLAAGTQANCSPSDGGASSNLVTDYAYDYLNRLASVRSFSGGSSQTDKADYTYDALDRVSKEVENHGGTANDRTTNLTYQGLTNLATEEKQAGGSNPKTKTFSYDAYGHRISMTDTDNATGASESFTYAHDVHGSVSQLITSAGTVKASYGYDAYGGSDAPDSDPQALSTGDTNPQAPVNPYRYAGKRIDSGTSATTSTGAGPAGYDMGSRRYGPDTTRFLQEDIFQGALGDLGLALDPLTQNRYALAGGNPISYVEIDGHMLIADGGGGSSTSPNPATTTSSTTPTSTAGYGTTVAQEQALATELRRLNPDEVNAAARRDEKDRFDPKPWEIANWASIPPGAIIGAGVSIRDWGSKWGSRLSTGADFATRSEAGRNLAKMRWSPTASRIGNAFRSPAGRIAGKVAGPVGFGISFVQHYAEGDKALTAGTKAGVEAAAAWGGAKIGFVAGCAVGGPVGCVVGGIAGGIGGAVLGNLATDQFGEQIESVTDPVQDALGTGARETGEFFSNAAEEAGDFFGGLFD